jgi:adenine-specific DNA-methyltransferase
MPNNFHQKLIDLLKKDDSLWDDEDELIIAAIDRRARRLDHDLVRLLLSDDEIKAKFFEEIDGHWIFNAHTFTNYLSSKNFLANSYTRFRNKIGLNIGDKYLRERGEVSLVWPYKDCVLEGGQTREEEKRKEVFFNELLAQDEINRLFDPKVLTNWKRYTVEGEENPTEIQIQRDENGVIRENLIIKGNNLVALHTLKDQFRGKVKLIYIDPPYNTGSDSFGYNDNFNHSSWLTFMKNRLEVARELLTDEGIIFIHIDDQEMHYLKVAADDIFGRDNFIATVPRKTRSGKSDVPYKLSQDFDWMLMYTRGASKKDALFGRTVKRKYYKTPDFPDDEWRLTDLTTQRTIHERPNSNFTLVNPRNGEGFPVNPNRCWGITKDSVDGYLSRGKIVFPGDYDFHNLKRPAMRVFKSEDMGKKAYVSSDFLNQVMDELLTNMVNRGGTNEILELFGDKAFAYPKNELLLQRIIEYTTEDGDIVLDFHLGSGTTLAVAHKMGRQYIGIEQMDYAEDIPVKRLKKVIDGEKGGISDSVNWQGGGDFVYCELMQYNETYMDKIQAAESSEALVALWEDIAENSFLNYYINPKAPEDAVEAFKATGLTENGLEKQKKCLAEQLDKNQLYVLLSEIDDEDFNVNEDDKTLNCKFHGE